MDYPQFNKRTREQIAIFTFSSLQIWNSVLEKAF